RNELVLKQRWGLLAVFIVVAAIGRFLTVAYIRPWMTARKAAAAAVKPAGAKTDGLLKRNFIPISIVLLIIYPFVAVALVGVHGSLQWVDNFGIHILIYVMLAWSINIAVGLAGLLVLGYVAFYVLGAYAYAMLSHHFGFSFWTL